MDYQTEVKVCENMEKALKLMKAKTIEEGGDKLQLRLDSLDMWRGGDRLCLDEFPIWNRFNFLQLMSCINEAQSKAFEESLRMDMYLCNFMAYDKNISFRELDLNRLIHGKDIEDDLTLNELLDFMNDRDMWYKDILLSSIFSIPVTNHQ